jgi:hypothetical protein
MRRPASDHGSLIATLCRTRVEEDPDSRLAVVILLRSPVLGKGLVQSPVVSPDGHLAGCRVGGMLDHIDVAGLRIAYERAGHGPPLVVLHGYVGDSLGTWRHQIDGLSDEFTVVAWDAPGAGQSSDPPSPSDWRSQRRASAGLPLESSGSTTAAPRWPPSRRCSASAASNPRPPTPRSSPPVHVPPGAQRSESGKHERDLFGAKYLGGSRGAHFGSNDSDRGM